MVSVRLRSVPTCEQTIRSVPLTRATTIQLNHIRGEGPHADGPFLSEKRWTLHEKESARSQTSPCEGDLGSVDNILCVLFHC